MKKKNRLAKAVMAVSVMTMGLGLVHSLDLEAQTTGGVCCQGNSDGCTDAMGTYWPHDYKTYNATCTCKCD